MHETQITRRHVLTGGAIASLSGLAPGLCSVAKASEESADRYGIRGRPAPEINLDFWIDAAGKPTTFSVTQSRGKWLLLKFFQNWCPGCHASGFPTLKAFSDALHGHPRVAIAAVQTVFEGFDTNTQAAVRELQLRYDLPVTMGHDGGDPASGIPALTMINYRTGGTPWLVLVDPDGVVVYNNFHVNSTKLIEYVTEQVG